MGQSIFLVHEGVATPLPLRGGVPEGRGGVCIFFTDKKLETPPLPLPLKGGECLRNTFCHAPNKTTDPEKDAESVYAQDSALPLA